MVFSICEEISCSLFYDKELDVIVHKSISLYNSIKVLAILHPKSLSNLVVDVGTRRNYQILMEKQNIHGMYLEEVIFCLFGTKQRSFGCHDNIQGVKEQ